MSTIIRSTVCRHMNKNIATVFVDYGVLHSWGCKRIFPLKSNDPDDTHYLHKDGRLHMIDKEPIDQESYCIENVLSPSDGSTEVSFKCNR